MEPVVRTSDYYFSKIGKVPQFTFIGRYTNLPFVEDIKLTFLRRSTTCHRPIEVIKLRLTIT